jgi:hypothetical protein
MKVDAYVTSTLEEMKWNTQGKDITCRAFHFTGQRSCRECMTRFRIDGRTIKRGKLVCISVILCHLNDLTLHAMLGSSGVVKGVKNPLKMFVKMLTHVHKCWITLELTHLHKG